MKRVTNISVGIPAYNEAGNIKQLLQSVLSQKEDGFVLQEIIVMCDGSTDGTPEKVQEVQNAHGAKRIKIHYDGKRLGKSARLDQIFRTFKGEVLVLMDADITINDKQLLSKLVAKSDFVMDGIVGINATSLPADTFFERSLEASVHVMKFIARKWNKGNNYLAFKGCLLALDGTFARSLHMPANLVSNDAFLYFAAKNQGYLPRYLEKVYAFYKSPVTFADHLNQSSRHQNSRKELAKYFDVNWKKEYAIPRMILVMSTLKQLILDPVHMISYLGIRLVTKLKRDKHINSLWEVAVTTKS